MAIILGNLQLLEERVDGDDTIRGFIADALWSAQRGADLTHRLLAFARRQSLNPDVIDLNEVVAGMSDLLRRTLGAAVEIREQLDPTLWKALVDKGELERALVNLAINAREAMRNSGVLTIETRNVVLGPDYAEHYPEVTPGDYAMLAVTDTGVGMPPEILRRAFEPFFTTKEVGQGSGLGLSMVYGFVKQSSGHVSVYSEVGRGTIVKLYFPRATASDAAIQEVETDSADGKIDNKVVLVVEDDAKLRKIAVKMLSKLGCRVVEAENAAKAFRCLEEMPQLDLLFTDLELPGGVNGVQLANRMREVRPDARVLFTTGYSKDFLAHERRGPGQAPLMSKPYSLDELRRQVQAIFAERVH